MRGKRDLPAGCAEQTPEAPQGTKAARWGVNKNDERILRGPGVRVSGLRKNQSVASPARGWAHLKAMV